jgi:predicted glycoside hydrolase/deacetylase ChbG (UPF0249 family)
VHTRTDTPEHGKRTLVVTGDDFGLTPGISRGIVHAHLHGILTHTSLMATAPFVAEAIDLALQTPSLSLGVHLLLVDGKPCLRASKVPTLVNDLRQFQPTAGAFVRDWCVGQINPTEVERELRAQIERVLSSGLRPTHLDSHKHLHMWPPIFHLVVRLAQEYGIPAVRVAAERPAVTLLREHLHDRGVRSQAIGNLLMVPLAWLDRLALPTSGVGSLWFVGRVHTGRLTVDRLKRMVGRLPPGGAELMTHPGFVDAHLASANTRLRQEREHELQLLCAPAVLALMQEAGIELAEGRVPRNVSQRTEDAPQPVPAALPDTNRDDPDKQGQDVCCES